MEDNLIIIACYLNIDGLNRANADMLFNQYDNYLSSKFDGRNIIYNIFPVRNQETKIETIYPNNNSDVIDNSDTINEIYKMIATNKISTNKELQNSVKILERKYKILKLKSLINE